MGMQTRKNMNFSCLLSFGILRQLRDHQTIMNVGVPPHGWKDPVRQIMGSARC